MNLVDVYKAARTSKTLEKLASASEGEVRDTLLRTKIAIDEEIFETAKLAMGPVAQKVMKGALITSAAAVPLGIAGYYLKNQADETSSLLQNKALQTALGLAAVGAGLYGLNKLTSEQPKMASDDNALLEEAREKLATVGMVDDLLARLPESLSKEAAALANEIRALNRGYGVHLLCELADG